MTKLSETSADLGVRGRDSGAKFNGARRAQNGPYSWYWWSWW